MKSTKIRSFIAAGVLGATALTGLFAASAAGAIGTGGGTGPNSHGPRSGPLAGITAEQKTCLAGQGITRPQGKPTAEQRQAIRDAAANCGITIPQGAKGAGRAHRLTQEQRDCLASNGITKPDHQLSAEERAAFKAQLQAAAGTCGIQLPAAH